MNLELRHIVHDSDVKRILRRPFEPHVDFNDDWWSRGYRLFGKPSLFVECTSGDSVVARVELDEGVFASEHVGAPVLGPEALRIQLFEVAQSWRRHGIGTEVVQLLVDEFQSRRLFALSEGADEFWGSLGWLRFDGGDPPFMLQPLFVGPHPSR